MTSRSLWVAVAVLVVAAAGCVYGLYAIDYREGIVGAYFDRTVGTRAYAGPGPTDTWLARAFGGATTAFFLSALASAGIAIRWRGRPLARHVLQRFAAVLAGLAVAAAVAGVVRAATTGFVESALYPWILDDFRHSGGFFIEPDVLYGGAVASALTAGATFTLARWARSGPAQAPPAAAR